MSIEQELFEAISCEDVIVFAGAGFSKYAGYPTGDELRDIIHLNLSEELKPDISKGLPLDSFSEEVVRRMNNSRELINDVLDKVFLAPPKSLLEHVALTSFPHFKTIITTNYDSLFEQALGDRGNLLFRDEHMSLWDDNKVNIIKIHGDLSDKTTIVLTREDYSRFIKKDYSSPLWASIISKISSKRVLFLGYGYEDSNVWAVIESVTKALGVNTKPKYFIAPDQSQHKISFLNRKGIQYLNYSASTFLEALKEHMMLNIFKDFENGKVSADTFRGFTRFNNTAVNLLSAEKGFKLGAIEGIEGRAAHWNAKFSYPRGSDYADRYKAFSSSNDLLELVLTNDELINFSMTVEGMRIMDKETFGTLIIKKKPKIIQFDLSFINEGLDIYNLNAQVYYTNGNLRIITKLHTLNIEVNVDINDLSVGNTTWHIHHIENYERVQQELEVYTFLMHLFRKKTITVFLKNGGSFQITSPVINESYSQDAENFTNYFKGLKKVEQAFGVKFRNFWTIDDGSHDMLRWLLKVVDGKSIKLQDEYIMECNEIDSQLLQHFERLDSTSDQSQPMEMLVDIDIVKTLHGIPLRIRGYKLVIPQPLVKNIEQLKLGVTKQIVFSSKNDTMTETFYIHPLSSPQS